MRMPQWQQRHINPVMDNHLQPSMDGRAGREFWIRLIHTRQAIESLKAFAIGRGQRAGSALKLCGKENRISSVAQALACVLGEMRWG